MQRLLNWLFPPQGRILVIEHREPWHCVYDEHSQTLHRGDEASATAFVASIRDKEFTDEVVKKAW